MIAKRGNRPRCGIPLVPEGGDPAVCSRPCLAGHGRRPRVSRDWIPNFPPV